MIAQLHIYSTQSDKRIQRVVTDDSWTCSDGPIRSDSTYYGETYDARLETPGWAQPGFSPLPGRPWRSASVVRGVVAQLNSQGMPPIKHVRTLRAVSVHKVPLKPSNATCAEGNESAKLTVACTGSHIQAVNFFSFGTPVGSCARGGIAAGACDTNASLAATVARTCVGQETCAIECSGGRLGSCTIAPTGPFCQKRCLPVHVTQPDPCVGTLKRMLLSIGCAVPPLPPTTKAFKYVYDFGQEFAGVVRLSLPPHTLAGTRVVLRHAEALAHEPLVPPQSADGSVYMGNLFWANPVDVYIVKGGDSPEVYEPSFTYHGFRYVELDSGAAPLPVEPDLDTVVGINLRTAASEAASLRLGEDPHDPQNLLQRLSNNSWWTEAAALMSIPAGAAGRGERNGWTGDAAFAAESEAFDFDTAAFFSRYLSQVADAQGANGEVNGGVPNAGTAPAKLHGEVATPFDPSWSAVLPLVAYQLWKYHNGLAGLAYAWEGLSRYYTMLQTNYSVQGGSTYGKWGDWNPASPSPRSPNNQGPPFTLTVSHITAATMVVQNLIEAAEMSRAMGKVHEAARYEALIPLLKRQYHDAFFDPEGQVYGDGTLTAFGAALWLEVTPPEQLAEVVSNFVRTLHGLQYRMVGVGFIGVRYIFEALAKVNRSDVALRMLNSTEYPSFGWCMTNPIEPATSLWESYDVPTMRQWLAESSRDHHYSATINTYLRKYVAGLDQPVGSNAWHVVKCRPEPIFWPELLPTASVMLHSRRGDLGCSWRSRALGPPPPRPSMPPIAVRCAYSPMWTGALIGRAPLQLRCPENQTIARLKFAKWQRLIATAAPPDGSDGWHCYGKQPPPQNVCESDVTAKLAPLCVGKNGCNLNGKDRVDLLGEPCSQGSAEPARPTQLIVRIACSTDRQTPSRQGARPSRQGAQPSSESAPPHPAYQQPRIWATVNATIPSGSAGEIHVPVRSDRSGTVTESGIVVWQNGKAVGSKVGVKLTGGDGRFLIFATGSGNYSFACAHDGLYTNPVVAA